MTLDYFYGQSGELFSYFRIPKALFQDSRFRQLSTDARTLYGILLDRMSLSVKNGWMDKQGRVYIIYTVREVQESLCCAEHKAVKLFRELEQIDLIERKRRGLGRPSLIYVKDFTTGLSKIRKYSGTSYFPTISNQAGQGTIREVAEAYGKSSSTPSCAGECVSGFDAAVDAESVCFHPCTADDVYFRLWTLYAVLPGVDAVLDPVGSRVRLFPAHHCRNGYCGSRGMVQRLDCRTVMGKVFAYCPYSRIDFISFAIYNRKTY